MSKVLVLKKNAHSRRGKDLFLSTTVWMCEHERARVNAKAACIPFKMVVVRRKSKTAQWLQKNEKKYQVTFLHFNLGFKKNIFLFILFATLINETCTKFVYIFFYLAIAFLFVLSQFFSFIQLAVCVIMRFLFSVCICFAEYFISLNFLALSVCIQQFAVVTYRKKT